MGSLKGVTVLMENSVLMVPHLRKLHQVKYLTKKPVGWETIKDRRLQQDAQKVMGVD